MRRCTVWGVVVYFLFFILQLHYNRNCVIFVWFFFFFLPLFGTSPVSPILFKIWSLGCLFTKVAKSQTCSSFSSFRMEVSGYAAICFLQNKLKFAPQANLARWVVVLLLKWATQNGWVYWVDSKNASRDWCCQAKGTVHPANKKPTQHLKVHCCRICAGEAVVGHRCLRWRGRNNYSVKVSRTFGTR